MILMYTEGSVVWLQSIRVQMMGIGQEKEQVQAWIQLVFLNFLRFQNSDIGLTSFRFYSHLKNKIFISPLSEQSADGAHSVWKTLIPSVTTSAVQNGEFQFHGSSLRLCFVHC